MKKTLLFLLLLGLILPVSAQENLVDKVVAASARIKSLSCNFTQTRTVAILSEPVVSQGTMVFQAPDYIKWEYTTPQSIILTINGAEVQVLSEGKSLLPNAQSGRMYREISKFLMGSVSGNLLKDEKVFEIGMSQEGGRIIADITPRKGDIKRMFSHITMVFNASDLTAERIIMTEEGGDKTEIRFTHIKVAR